MLMQQLVQQQLFAVSYIESDVQCEPSWAEITHGAVPFVVFHACQLIFHNPIQSSNLTFIHN